LPKNILELILKSIIIKRAKIKANKLQKVNITTTKSK